MYYVCIYILKASFGTNWLKPAEPSNILVYTAKLTTNISLICFYISVVNAVLRIVD